MKKILTMMCVAMLAFVVSSHGQIQTVFRGGSVGGYGALSNKFTKIGGKYANVAEIYGGVYLNRHFLIGIGGAAVTNDIPVPEQFSTVPGRKLSYEYGQCGLVTEYVVGSDKAVHMVFHLFSGGGFTVQYDRNGEDNDFYDEFDDQDMRDENWFFVAEPGVQVEVNLLRWMRFSPGISYRAAFGSDARGLSDSDISNISYNATLKFGRF